jgi:uncharacterized protein (TIGR02145 family)
MSQALAQNKGGIVRDIQGNKYKTVLIGEQEWMSENLKTTTFNDGTDIPLITDMTDWVRTSTPAYSWYDNKIGNKETYGALYNWYAVNTGKLCPDGWRIATDEDWTKLAEFLGGDSIAGVKLNKSGFSVLPGGYRYGYYWGSGIFYEKGINGYWWTSTRATNTHIWSRTINRENAKIYRSYFIGNNGFYVKCIKCN